MLLQCCDFGLDCHGCEYLIKLLLHNPLQLAVLLVINDNLVKTRPVLNYLRKL